MTTNKNVGVSGSPTQDGLFDLEELEDMPEVKVLSVDEAVEKLVSPWIKSNTSKKRQAIMRDALKTAISRGAPFDDMQFILSRPHLFPSKVVFTLDELREAWKHLDREREIAKCEETAAEILSKWGSRSTVSKTSLSRSITSVTSALISGVSIEDIEYAVGQRTLLASHKRIDEFTLEKALKRVPVDKQAGKDTQVVFNAWYEKWYKGRYTQSVGQIISVIKKALLDGFAVEELAAALEHLGRGQQVITAPSIQYAVQHVNRVAERRSMSGAHDDLIAEDEYGMMGEEEYMSPAERAGFSW